MDQDNSTSIFLLPKLILMADRNLNADLPIRQAVVSAIVPIVVCLLIAKLLRRSIGKKISTFLTPTTDQLIHIDGYCDDRYRQIKRAF